MSAKLKLVAPPPTTEEAIKALLDARAQAAAEIATIDGQLLPLRQAYARERGEFVPPSLERLRRELR